MNLYLIDKPFGENGIKLAVGDKAAVIALIQDGVYLDVGLLHTAGCKIYALKRDVEKRGLTHTLPDCITLIDCSVLVDLIVENKVFNFA
jgi:sulfur relay protein TusB/DsrH